MNSLGKTDPMPHGIDTWSCDHTRMCWQPSVDLSTCLNDLKKSKNTERMLESWS